MPRGGVPGLGAPRRHDASPCGAGSRKGAAAAAPFAFFHRKRGQNNYKEFYSNINWEVILWACGTVAVLLILAMLVLSILSARNMRRSRERMAQLQSDIKVGASILFGGGIYGKIVKIKDDVIDVEVGKDTVIQISRYAIQSVE